MNRRRSLFITVSVLTAACSSAPPSVPAPSAAAPVTPAPMAMAAPHVEIAPDIQFMRDMIAHHAQAILISGWVAARSNSQPLELLAERITISQNDEIARMRSWLNARGDTAAPAPEHEHRMMPGMLMPEDLTRLQAATSTEFDRLFLQDMIRHHEGALAMVSRLFNTPRGIQDPVLFQLATNIDADQRAEIARMQAMLSNLH